MRVHIQFKFYKIYLYQFLDVMIKGLFSNLIFHAHNY